MVVRGSGWGGIPARAIRAPARALALDRDPMGRLCRDLGLLAFRVPSGGAAWAFDPPLKRPALSRVLRCFCSWWLPCFAFFGIRLWYLQIYKSEFYKSQAQDNRTRQVPMFSPRGFIRERNGILLAENTPAYFWR